MRIVVQETGRKINEQQFKKPPSGVESRYRRIIRLRQAGLILVLGCLIIQLSYCGSPAENNITTFRDIAENYLQNKLGAANEGITEAEVTMPCDSFFIMLSALRIHELNLLTRFDSVRSLPDLPKNEFEKTKDWNARNDLMKQRALNDLINEVTSDYEAIIGVKLSAGKLVYDTEHDRKGKSHISKGSIVMCRCEIAPDGFDYDADREMIKLNTPPVPYSLEDGKDLSPRQINTKFSRDYMALSTIKYDEQGQIITYFSKQNSDSKDEQFFTRTAQISLLGAKVKPDKAKALKNIIAAQPIVCNISAYVTMSDDAGKPAIPVFAFYKAEFMDKSGKEIMNWSTRLEAHGGHYWTDYNRELVIETYF